MWGAFLLLAYFFFFLFFLGHRPQWMFGTATEPGRLCHKSDLWRWTAQPCAGLCKAPKLRLLSCFLVKETHCSLGSMCLLFLRLTDVGTPYTRKIGSGFPAYVIIVFFFFAAMTIRCLQLLKTKGKLLQHSRESSS